MLEDRRVGIAIDRADHFRVGDAHDVLARAGDGDGQVQLGRNFFAGLADLPTGGTQPASQAAREAAIWAPIASASLQFLERLGAAQAAAAGDDHAGIFQPHSFLGLDVPRHDLNAGRRLRGRAATVSTSPARAVRAAGSRIDARARTQTTPGDRASAITAVALPPYTPRVTRSLPSAAVNLDRVAGGAAPQAMRQPRAPVPGCRCRCPAARPRVRAACRPRPAPSGNSRDDIRPAADDRRRAPRRPRPRPRVHSASSAGPITTARAFRPGYRPAGGRRPRRLARPDRSRRDANKQQTTSCTVASRTSRCGLDRAHDFAHAPGEGVDSLLPACRRR